MIVFLFIVLKTEILFPKKGVVEDEK